MTFGEKLQKLRTRAGLSQDQLPKLLDVSRQAVSKWERNEAMPEAEKLVRISRQFGVSTRACGSGSSNGTGTGAICWPGFWRPGVSGIWLTWLFLRPIHTSRRRTSRILPG